MPPTVAISSSVLFPSWLPTAVGQLSDLLAVLARSSAEAAAMVLENWPPIVVLPSVEFLAGTDMKRAVCAVRVAAVVRELSVTSVPAEAEVFAAAGWDSEAKIAIRSLEFRSSL